MKRFKCIVSYDGTNYIGWQSQTRNNSIQEKIEGVIKQISKEDVNIVASGRTDAKVHAYGQVFHFDTEFYLDANRWRLAMNGYLPKDIYIRTVEEVDENFHARYSVIEKQYDYLINLGEFDVCTVNYAYQCRYTLNVEKMKQAATYLVGTLDFTSFCANTIEMTPNQVRHIENIKFTMENDVLRISYIGKGFLRYMVRMLTATLIEVGRGRIEPHNVKEMLEARDKEACRVNAEPQGLYLIRVEYE